MNDFFLKFPNQTLADSKFNEAGFYISGENGPILSQFTQDYALDLVGLISGADESYHANLRLLNNTFQVPTSFTPYIIAAPQNPARVWA
jgi:hypothetical protein